MTKQLQTETPKPKAVKKGKVSPKSKATPAKNYTTPNLFTIATTIKADDPSFLPVYNEPHAADVKISVPNVINHVQCMRLNHRSTHVFDCGIHLTIPPGYKLCGGTKNTMAGRGLFVPQVFLEDGRLKVMVVNMGIENPMLLNHGAVVAQIWLEPVYFFEWNQA